jgi:hypothetical protein
MLHSDGDSYSKEAHEVESEEKVNTLSEAVEANGQRGTVRLERVSKRLRRSNIGFRKGCAPRESLSVSNVNWWGLPRRHGGDEDGKKKWKVMKDDEVELSGGLLIRRYTPQPDDPATFP